MTEFLSQASTLALAETPNAALDLTAARLDATLAPARALRAKTAELAEMADMVREVSTCVGKCVTGAPHRRIAAGRRPPRGGSANWTAGRCGCGGSRDPKSTV